MKASFERNLLVTTKIILKIRNPNRLFLFKSGLLGYLLINVTKKPLTEIGDFKLFLYKCEIQII